MRHKKYIDLLPAYENVTYIEDGPRRLVEGGVAVGGAGDIRPAHPDRHPARAPINLPSKASTPWRPSIPPVC